MGAKNVEGREFLFRTTLVVGLSSVVAAIIYWTPFPDQSPQSCKRPCHELDWPMICRVKLVMEGLPCFKENCQETFMVNRRSPGPSFEVCENDIVVVDVVNRLAGQSLTIHWRGQSLKETPLMDGVPMITQCPILPSTTFQYKFRAAQPGSHFWHAIGGTGIAGRLFGAFTVRRSKALEEQSSLYDDDGSDHVLVIQVSQSHILLNGLNFENSHELSLNLIQNQRHRVRLLFSGSPTPCRVVFDVEKEALNLIALDGHPVSPVMASSVELGYGERADVIVQTSKNNVFVLMRIKPEIKCEHIRPVSIHVKILQDERNDHLNKIFQTAYSESLPQVRSMVDDTCDGLHTICLNHIRSLQDLPTELSQPLLDHKLFLFFGVRSLTAGVNASVVASDHNGKFGAPHINNRTMVWPPSPLMTQLDEIRDDLFCGAPCETGLPCECVHLIHIPLHQSLEIILMHQGGGVGPFSFHLHGNSFYVVESTVLETIHSTEEAIRLDREGLLLHRNMEKPPRRDTIVLPARGAAVLRLQADNPGYWLLDQELSPKGMQIILHIGEAKDLPSTPKNYPRCGDWVGPEFFLT